MQQTLIYIFQLYMEPSLSNSLYTCTGTIYSHIQPCISLSPYGLRQFFPFLTIKRTSRKSLYFPWLNLMCISMFLVSIPPTLHFGCKSTLSSKLVIKWRSCWRNREEFCHFFVSYLDILRIFLQTGQGALVKHLYFALGLPIKLKFAISLSVIWTF